MSFIFKGGDTLQLDGDPTSGRAALMPWHQDPAVLLGKKPVGPVSIDWTHPLSNGLVGCFVATNSRPVNLVTGEMLVDSSGTKGVPVAIGGIPGELGYGFDNTDDGYTSEDRALAIAGSCSVVARTYHSSFTSVNTICGWGGLTDAENDNYLHLINRSNSTVWRVFWEYGAGTNAIVDATTSLTDTFDWNTIGYSRTVAATSSVEIYENGESIGSDSGLSNPTGGLGGSASKFYLGRSAVATQHYHGRMSYLYLFNRALSADEHLSLYRNPYQFLKPAGP